MRKRLFMVVVVIWRIHQTKVTSRAPSGLQKHIFENAILLPAVWRERVPLASEQQKGSKAMISLHNKGAEAILAQTFGAWQAAGSDQGWIMFTPQMNRLRTTRGGGTKHGRCEIPPPPYLQLSSR